MIIDDKGLAAATKALLFCASLSADWKLGEAELFASPGWKRVGLQIQAEYRSGLERDDARQELSNSSEAVAA